MLATPILTVTPYVVRVDYAPGRAVLAVSTPPDARPDDLTTDTFHTRTRARAALSAPDTRHVPIRPLYPRQLTESADGRRATFGTRARWENVADDSHPLTGTEARYLAAEGDPLAAPEDGTVVVAPGHRVRVLAVFRHWNGPGGATLAYVHVHATGLRTHLPVGDLLPELDARV